MKILVIQLRRIGDILLTTPVLSYLKLVFPQSQIDFLCEPMGKSVLEHNPHISRLLLYDKNHPLLEIKRIRRERYDVVLDFLNNPRSSFLTGLSEAPSRVGFKSSLRSFFYNIRVPIPKTAEYVPLRKLRMVEEWLRRSGYPVIPKKTFRPELYLSEDDQTFVENWLKEKGLKTGAFVAMAPAHRHAIRQWRPEGFKEVAQEIFKNWGLKSCLAWGPGEDALMNEIRRGDEEKMELFPATSMRQMGSIIKRASLLVTNDSGTMHLAVAVGTPTVTIYGPTRPIDWNPSLSIDIAERVHDIPLNNAHLDCLGCHRHHCPIGHLCMKNLDSGRVLEACRQLLKGR